MKQNYINHIAFVLDASGSMHGLRNQVITVADNQIAHLAKRSKELDQETRVTVYTFDNPTNIQCLFYDKDVLRMPSLKGFYEPLGNTALIDATIRALDDLSLTPELYGDHAFLAYVLTDGEENSSRKKPEDLARKIKNLPDNWTLAAFVPNAQGKFEAKKFGFQADNIAIWDTTQKGLTEVGETIRRATDTFMTNRISGTRSSKNLFDLSDAVKAIDRSSVKALDQLHPGQYRLFDVKQDGQISAFIEKTTGRAYKIGEAYYQLTKSEKIQAGKVVALLDKKSHHVFTGANARKLLSLPDHEVKVAPAAHPDFEIFVQSTSTNRKLIAGTRLLLLS